MDKSEPRWWMWKAGQRLKVGINMLLSRVKWYIYSCRIFSHVSRCADLMSGVTKVLKSVGVTCCTVQPEFASCCSASSAGSDGGDASPVVHREDPSLPPLLACNLACGKACAGSMCCSPLEESRSVLAPPGGETMEEPQTLVIENTFLWLPDWTKELHWRKINEWSDMIVEL